MQKIKDISFDRGDVMLFQQAAKTLHLELKPADWEGIGQKAIDLKKYLFAQHALEKADNAEIKERKKYSRVLLKAKDVSPKEIHKEPP